MAGAVDIAMLVIGRIFLGFGVGLCSLVSSSQPCPTLQLAAVVCITAQCLDFMLCCVPLCCILGNTLLCTAQFSPALRALLYFLLLCRLILLCTASVKSVVAFMPTMNIAVMGLCVFAGYAHVQR